MNGLIHAIANRLAFQQTSTGAKVLVSDLPDVVADELAIEQIMSNLIENAIKYRDPNRTQEILITGHKLPGETAYVVRDRGIGIEQVDLSKIFRIFQRGRNHDAAGEGMGLAYARALARRHGGEIWCESEPGTGSTFTLTIPNEISAVAG
jgi:signal transduction histidine kinase